MTSAAAVEGGAERRHAPSVADLRERVVRDARPPTCDLRPNLTAVRAHAVRLKPCAGSSWSKTPRRRARSCARSSRTPRPRPRWAPLEVTEAQSGFDAMRLLPARALRPHHHRHQHARRERARADPLHPQVGAVPVRRRSSSSRRRRPSATSSAAASSAPTPTCRSRSRRSSLRETCDAPPRRASPRAPRSRRADG